ncbi:MAG TPA: DUF5678 domain-containing protein [Candidatus Limnocylindria bacterium]|nr:DUF5678 domain-containing protein [Candidatus Limnocylindria bacterium]
MPAKNWTKLFKNYKGQWVALKDDETTVISSGEKLAEVIRESENKGYQKPILTKIPKKDITYIGLS